MRKMVLPVVERADKGGAFKGSKVAVKQKKTEQSKSKVVLPHVPV